MAHNNTLPEDALRRSLVHSGNGDKVQKLFRKVLAGAIAIQYHNVTIQRLISGLATCRAC